MSQLSLSDMQIRVLLSTDLACTHKLPLCKQKCTGWWKQQIVTVQNTYLGFFFFFKGIYHNPGNVWNKKILLQTPAIVSNSVLR